MILAVLGSAMRDENHEQRREQVRQLPVGTLPILTLRTAGLMPRGRG
jgi:hypothetical protein